jgi:hypothetical protein
MYAVEFADAERKLREKHIGDEAKNWPSEFRVMGDVAVVVETDGLHFIPHDNARLPGNLPRKAKVLLMDASTAKDEAAFVLREGR